MKFKFLSLLLLSASLFMISCGDDEPEVCDVLADTLIDTWTVSAVTTSGDVTFNSDGTYVDDSNVILEYSNNGVDATINTWELDGMELSMTTSVDPAVGSGFASTTLTVTSFDCNTINANVGGFINITFTK